MVLTAQEALIEVNKRINQVSYYYVPPAPKFRDYGERFDNTLVRAMQESHLPDTFSDSFYTQFRQD